MFKRLLLNTSLVVASLLSAAALAQA
ncbi:MAG: hypothetical protein RLZZ192_1211, partial [Pseudomonadota bacterium]